MKHNINKFKAFTILEMSIVLVIIGLILGCIYGASELISQAKLKSIIKEIYKHQTAITNFKSQYNAMPGDFASATTVWPSATTANGNGNDTIERGANMASPFEDTYIFQHLYLSGALTEAYVGGTQSSVRKIIGKNLPISSYGQGTYELFTETIYNISATFLDFGALSNNTQQHANGPILKPLNARLIDNKIDDGIAYKGNILSGRTPATMGNTVCVTGQFTDAIADYITNDATVSCRLSIIITNNN